MTVSSGRCNASFIKKTPGSTRTWCRTSWATRDGGLGEEPLRWGYHQRRHFLRLARDRREGEDDGDCEGVAEVGVKKNKLCGVLSTLESKSRTAQPYWATSEKAGQ